MSKVQETIDLFYNNYSEKVNGNTFNDKLISLDICSKINNLLITEYGDENEKSLLIDGFMKFCNPMVTKLVLIDLDRFNFIPYRNIPFLTYPAINDINNANSLIKRVVSEMEKRYDLFNDKRVKSIESYNNTINEYNDGKCFKNKAAYMPYIILVVDEVFELIHNKEIVNNLLKIALNGSRAGIKIIAYSKVRRRSLNLGSFGDLFKNVNSFHLDKLINGNIDYDEKSELDYMDGFDFENYSAELLKANGFTNVEVTQYSNDFGVDVIAYKDDIKYAIQCKKYSSPVGIKAVQEVIGSKVMNDCHVAVVLTNNTFTKSAIELAEKNNVLLWDANKLKELIDNYQGQ